MKTFTIANLKVTAVRASDARICYILYPFDALGEWIEQAADTFGVSVVTIEGMDWDNDLTPWPAKGQPPGCPDFEGHAPAFLALIRDEVLPETERRLNLVGDVERTLAGVSLSGLFALWQWLTDDTFRNIISLSGSFWYEGFVGWVKSRPAPKKTGRAYFLLGNQEAKTTVKAFRTVQTDTAEIAAWLMGRGIDDIFELVPGNHYQYALQRLDRSFAWMFGR